MAAEDEDDGGDDDGGGVVASHELELDLPMYIAPSVGSEFNSFNPPFIAIACTRLNDARFEFDSSIIRPRVAREMRRLGVLWDRTPGRHASVFGHADPTGSDDYNKQLSGRRATAVYALLTRKTDLWEKLYSEPLGGDNWSIRSLQLMLGAVHDPTGAPYLATPPSGQNDGPTIDAVKAFQGDQGLTRDGVAGPVTRRALFLAYMDTICCRRDKTPFQLTATDFLGQGSDPDGKADYQGCSEFNPVRVFSRSDDAAFAASPDKTERNQRNEVNRRVMIFLFRPGLVVEPSRWPCPRVKEGVGECKKQFWPDGEARRTPGSAQREYAETQDTFACAFYDGMAHRSPCEGVVIIQAVRIRLFDRDARALAGAPYRVMSGQTPERGVSDAHGFITLRDVSAPATVTVRWSVPDDEKRKRGSEPATDPDRFDFEKLVFVDAERRATRDQVRTRLANLGFDRKPTLKDNVLAFQHEYGLAESGDPDDAVMQAALRERHDAHDPKPVDPPREKPIDVDSEGF